MAILVEDLYQQFLASNGVSTDSRSVSPGQIFFALRGPSFDGNAYAEQALEKGATCAVVSDRSLSLSSPDYCYVPNTLTALQRLAHRYRKDLKCRVIGITGSNGKTTSKELLQAVLSVKYSTQCTQGNFNNHIGVPLTILSIKPDTEIAIVEMGANAPGEIKLLCHIADPTDGIITNIGQAHLEGFGSLDVIRRTKFALYHHVVSRKEKGFFFKNLDEPSLDSLPNHQKVIPFSAQALGEGVSWVVQQSTPHISALLHGREEHCHFRSGLYADYNVLNIQSAIGMAIQFGLKLEGIKQGIESYVPSSNRSQLLQYGSTAVYLDAYNANPTSMAAAIDFFDQLGVPSKCMILGDMLELGTVALAAHENILKQAQASSAELVFLVGANFLTFMHKVEQPGRIAFFPDVETLRKAMSKMDWEHKTLYIKGSRSIRLEETLEIFADPKEQVR